MAANTSDAYNSALRIRIWYALLVLVLAVFAVRLFYVQIIRHDDYKAAALNDQLKQYEIPAQRGHVLARDGNRTVPIVLNQKLYTVYADPAFIKDHAKTAAAVQDVIGGDTGKLESQMRTKNSRFVILAKKVGEAQKERLVALKHPGIGVQRQDYRTYPQGTLAAQTLGFVNDEGKGLYGVEQALDDELRGKPGELKAITDVRGIPLAANPGNIQKPAKPGKDVVLTIDIAAQKQLETILADGIKQAKAESGSAVILDIRSGAVKAIASYPSYDPAKFYEVENDSVYTNSAVSKAIEIGSIMKPLTTAAALDTGAVKPDQTYHDPGVFTVDGAGIRNVAGVDGVGARSVTDILNLSLNTGATWLLQEMGGGTLNSKGREIWYKYMTDRFQFGKRTGIEQGYESEGYVPGPKDTGAGINLTYANTTFGQAMTATPLQVAAALSAVLNGGTYYQPHLIEQIREDGKEQRKQSKVVRSGVVSAQTGKELQSMMEYIIAHRTLVPAFDLSRYMVGGKTGTAEVAKPGGGYHKDVYNGTYMGFVGGNNPEYVIVVFVEKPKLPGYAGTVAAQPIFMSTAHMLINHSYVSAKN